MTAKNSSLEVRCQDFLAREDRYEGNIDEVAFLDFVRSIASEAVAGERARLVKVAEECKDPWQAHIDGNPIAATLKHNSQNCEVQKALIVEALRTGSPS